MNFYIEHYKNVIEKEFDVKVITPLFLGGADKISAELRTASFKGLLRFWWRTIYGNNDINKMKQEEEIIFGSTNRKSLVKIIIEKGNSPPVKKNLPQGRKLSISTGKRNINFGIIDYLAYGIRDHKNGYEREHFPVETKFKLAIQYNKNIEEQIIKSFSLLINYGGLGAKSRNGFGSLYIQEKQLEKYSIEQLNKVEPKYFTAFSKYTKLFNNFKDKNLWIEALSDIGEVYIKARRSLENLHLYKKRSLIAKPIIQADERYIKEGRHSKPYFLHVNKTQNGYKGQILFLPYNYKAPNDNRRFSEYIKICNEMNKKIEQFIGDLK
ncbi:MAG: type III-B CRISPR module RAMP protein Cmr1 [Spirochaetales bacterium]|nr:type III-B CRISPR module RAMP protein Cmr1 [Spirochaetales bacterium]